VSVRSINGMPLPNGWPGELYIGGAGVTRGYLGRPDETKERFVADPYGGGRLYRTGDLGRRLPDGQLEWLSRMDNQLKVRGYRVEPEDIEKTLVAHPAVRDAAVVVHRDAPDPAVLAASLSKRPDAEALLKALEDQATRQAGTST